MNLDTPGFGDTTEYKTKLSVCLIGEMNMHSADDLVMCLNDFNGYVGSHFYGSNVFHGGYGVGQRNLEGGMLQQFCLEEE